VALAEEGWHSGNAAEVIATEYLAKVAQRPAELRPDTAILGCTHFPLLQTVIADVLGGDIQIVDSASTTAAAVQSRLAADGLLAGAAKTGQLSLLATDGVARFSRIGSAFLGHAVTTAGIELVDIHPTDTQ
jgi:glutamate racemase